MGPIARVIIFPNRNNYEEEYSFKSISNVVLDEKMCFIV